MKQLYKIKYWNIQNDYDINKMLYLLVDRPKYITSWNDFHWINNKNQIHRDYNLPAVIWNNNLKYIKYIMN